MTEHVEMTDAQAAKVYAEIGKLIAETAKINAEARWYPLVVTGGMFAAALAVAKLFL